IRGGREYARRHFEEEHGAQRRDAEDRGRCRDLRGDRRRRVAHLRTGRGAADGAALLLVLTVRRCSARAASKVPAAGTRPPPSTAWSSTRTNAIVGGWR